MRQYGGIWAGADRCSTQNTEHTFSPYRVLLCCYWYVCILVTQYLCKLVCKPYYSYLFLTLFSLSVNIIFYYWISMERAVHASLRVVRIFVHNTLTLTLGLGYRIRMEWMLSLNLCASVVTHLVWCNSRHNFRLCAIPLLLCSSELLQSKKVRYPKSGEWILGRNALISTCTEIVPNMELEHYMTMNCAKWSIQCPDTRVTHMIQCGVTSTK